MPGSYWSCYGYSWLIGPVFWLRGFVIFIPIKVCHWCSIFKGPFKIWGYLISCLYAYMTMWPGKFLFWNFKIKLCIELQLWLGWQLWNICVTNDHGYVPLVVNTSRSFPHSRLITWFVTRSTQRVPLVEQVLLPFRSTWVHPRFLVGFVLLVL